MNVFDFPAFANSRAIGVSVRRATERKAPWINKPVGERGDAQHSSNDNTCVVLEEGEACEENRDTSAVLWLVFPPERDAQDISGGLIHHSFFLGDVAL